MPKEIRSFIIKTLTTFFYIGYLPFIPGTFASIFGIFIFFLIKDIIFLHILFILILIVLGFLLTGKAETVFNKKDAKCIVIDEIVGILLALLFIPYDIKLVIIAFCLFRILDAVKPYPANKLEKLKGSLGIMSDDLVAGLYTNMIIQFVLRCASFKTS